MENKKSLQINDIENIFKERKAGAEDFFRFFSVLIPLVNKDGKLHVMYEVRAKHMDRQPGEICFPGGQMEPDETPEECALRETWEETGIPVDKIRIISRLDTIVSTSNFAMHCFLGEVDAEALDMIDFNPDEVDEVFLVELDWLLENEPEIYWTTVHQEAPEDFPYERVVGRSSYPWRKSKVPVPVYAEWDGKVIWGLTGRITRRLIDLIKENEEKENV